MVDFYDFRNTHPDIRSLIHAVSLLGNNLVCVEVGGLRAESSCTLLQCCENIKTLHLIDLWCPYTDTLGTNEDQEYYHVDKKQIEFIEFTARHNIKYSGFEHKTHVHKMSSIEAAKLFGDSSIDFIFLDSFLTRKDVVDDLNAWYSKIKPGGIFAGHDANSKSVKQELTAFINKNNVKSNICVYDNTWSLKK